MFWSEFGTEKSRSLGRLPAWQSCKEQAKAMSPAPPASAESRWLPTRGSEGTENYSRSVAEAVGTTEKACLPLGLCSAKEPFPEVDSAGAGLQRKRFCAVSKAARRLGEWSVRFSTCNWSRPRTLRGGGCPWKCGLESFFMQLRHSKMGEQALARQSARTRNRRL